LQNKKHAFVSGNLKAKRNLKDVLQKEKSLNEKKKIPKLDV